MGKTDTMKHTLQLLTVILPVLLCATVAKSDKYIVLNQYEDVAHTYVPTTSNSLFTAQNNSAGMVAPFSNAPTPFTGGVASYASDDDDWGAGGGSGFDNPGEPGNPFKQPLGAPFVMLFFAALYAIRRKFFNTENNKI